MTILSPLLLTAAATLVAQPAFPDVYVDNSNPLGCLQGDGSAVAPVCSINAALAFVAPGDTIRIAPGTYFEELVLPFALNLVGTGGAEVTTIQGFGTGSSGSVVTIPNPVPVTIDGLTIRNGSAPFGGGINFTGPLTIVNSLITENNADIAGGGIYANADTAFLTITGSTILLNTCWAGTGGGISLAQGSGEFTNARISSNRAMFAGGVSFTGDDSLLDQLNLTDSSLLGNRIGSETGGAMIHTDGILIMSGTSVVNNSAPLGTGAGLVLRNSEFSITNSTISGNRTDALFPGGQFGGPSGGILCEAGASGSISHATITGNIIGPFPGAGVDVTPGSGPVTVLNTIIAGNLSLTLNQTGSGNVGGTLVSLGGNLIGDGGNGANGFVNGVLGDIVGAVGAPINPMTGPFVNNGGPTETLALLPGSPAIDAGNLASFELVDQRGVMRIQGAGPDIGAFELRVESDELCNGDGGNGMGCTPCPCGNDAAAGTIGGCLNTLGRSGQMTRAGSSSVGTGDLRFEALDLPANSAAILLSGAALAPANSTNPCFGLNSGVQSVTQDGLRCLVQGVLRHGVRSADANGAIGAGANGWGTPGGFFNFGSFMAGQTRYFQVTYRDDLAFGCQTGLNTTQASSVTFVP